MGNNFKSHNERLLVADIQGCITRMGQLVDEFSTHMLPGPKQKRLAKAIKDILNEILEKEQELVRIKKMSIDYSRRRS